MIYKGLCLCFIFVFSTLHAQSQFSIKEIKNQAEEYTNHEQYYKAIKLYERVIQIRPTEKLDLYNVGYCYFKTNQLDQAEKYFVRLLNQDKKADGEAYLLLANINHQKENYQQAIRFYKIFLRKKGKNHTLSQYAIGQIKRCGVGRQYSQSDQLAYVENLGSTLNSKFDESIPHPSPNYNDRIYFSSIREGNTGGPLDENGTRDIEHGNYRSDMFVASLNQGSWSNPFPLNEDLNTDMNEYLLGFRGEGRLVYFERSNDYLTQIKVDTFVDHSSTEAIKKTGTLDNPYGITYKGGLQYFNDTIMLFASKTLEGYGGFDIYLSKYRNGSWSIPQNLGPRINTRYDEISPFMTKNGRKIFFSSNRETSIGGFDIFQSDYSDRLVNWNFPKNVLSPINSPADDIHFVLSEDGLRGWFASSRYKGHGGLDLYSCFLKSKVEAHSVQSNPLTFDEVTVETNIVNGNQSENNSDAPINDPIFSPDEIKDFVVSPIFYDQNDFILSNANVKIIDKYINLVRSYPTLKILLTAHSDDTDSKEFEHYFSVKRAEKLADYMIQKDIPSDRIVIQGCGSQYPVALNYQDGKGFRVGQGFNRRIEVQILNEQNMPINVKYESPKIAERIALQQGGNYNLSNKGLHYRILLISTNQPFTGAAFLQAEFPAVEKEMNVPVYKYIVGNYNSYAVANSDRAEFVGQGLLGAKVIPYYDGVRVPRDQLSQLSDVHIDLIYYLEDNP